MRQDDEAALAREATVTRHNDFVEAISNTIGMVEKALKESNVDEEAESGLIWARLDKGEKDELALFLSCPCSEEKVVSLILSDVQQETGSSMSGETSVRSKNHSYQLNKLSSGEKDHYRTDSGTEEVAVLVDTDSTSESSLKPLRLSNENSKLRTAESSSKPKKWYRHGFMKCKDPSQKEMKESLPLRSHPLSRVL